MNQLTLRKIPEAVKHELRRLADQSQQSINRTVIKVLEKGLGIDESKGKKRDLRAVIGQWNDDDAAEFERNVAICETIDEEIWH